MSHYDWIIDGLAALGFFTLCAFLVFFFLMAKDGLHDKRQQASANKKETERAIKEVEAILGLGGSH